MCLTHVDQQPQYPQTRIGYKVIDIKKNGDLCNPYTTTTNGETTYNPIGKWTVDKKDLQIPNTNQTRTYKSGFHIYDKVEDARFARWYAANRKVFQVEYDDVVATGVEEALRYGFGDNEKVIVARKMKVIKQCV